MKQDKEYQDSKSSKILKHENLVTSHVNVGQSIFIQTKIKKIFKKHLSDNIDKQISSIQIEEESPVVELSTCDSTQSILCTDKPISTSKKSLNLTLNQDPNSSSTSQRKPSKNSTDSSDLTSKVEQKFSIVNSKNRTNDDKETLDDTFSLNSKQTPDSRISFPGRRQSLGWNQRVSLTSPNRRISEKEVKWIEPSDISSTASSSSSSTSESANSFPKNLQTSRQSVIVNMDHPKGRQISFKLDELDQAMKDYLDEVEVEDNSQSDT